MPRKPRSIEEQAALDAALSSALAMNEEHRLRMDAIEEEFLRPQFSRRLITKALGVAASTFAHWHTRDQLSLDADRVRIGRSWRLFSARDVLRLGVATHLSAAGFPASKLRPTIEALEAVFPFSTRNRHLAANVVVNFAITPAGDIIGPEIGAELDMTDSPATVFTILRMDGLIHSSLELLGVTMTHGNAEDHRRAIDRLPGPTTHE